MYRSKQRTGVVLFLYIGLYVCSSCDGFTGICADSSLTFTPFTSENSVFENRAEMSTGTNGKLRAATIRAVGIILVKGNSLSLMTTVPLLFCKRSTCPIYGRAFLRGRRLRRFLSTMHPGRDPNPPKVCRYVRLSYVVYRAKFNTFR